MTSHSHTGPVSSMDFGTRDKRKHLCVKITQQTLAYADLKPKKILVKMQNHCVHICSDLKWTQHVDAVSAKIASRLYFVRQLKRAGATSSDLLCFYCTIIRPMIEYASPV